MYSHILEYFSTTASIKVRITDSCVAWNDFWHKHQRWSILYFKDYPLILCTLLIRPEIRNYSLQFEKNKSTISCLLKTVLNKTQRWITLQCTSGMRGCKKLISAVREIHAQLGGVSETPPTSRQKWYRGVKRGPSTGLMSLLPFHWKLVSSYPFWVAYK